MKRVATTLLTIVMVFPWLLTNANASVSVEQTTAKPAVQKVIKTQRFTPKSSRSYARTKVSDHQFRCLNNIWTRESHWNHKADNPTSTAYGIPQMLGMKTKNAYRQINIGLRYIRVRYGTPCNAWEFWKRNHWY